MLVSDAITRVRSLLAENQAGFFQDNEIIAWLNEANMDFHNKKGIETVWTTTIDDNTSEVSIDPTMVKLNRLYYTPDGSDSVEYIPPSEYQIFADRIIFNNDLDAGTLTWLGEKLPSVVSSLTDTIEVPTEFENAIIDYAVFRAMEKDQNPNAQMYFAEYQAIKSRFERKRVDKNAGGKVHIYKRW